MTDQVAALVGRLSRAVHCMQFAQGLNPAQWDALRFLSRANRYSRGPSALADYLGTTKGTASQTIKALEAKGLIRRSRRDGDRRGVQLELTEDGVQVLDGDPLRRIESIAVASCGDTGETAEVLRRLLDGLTRATGAAVFGTCADCCHLCGAKTGEEGYRCGLTEESLGESELLEICYEFRPHDTA